MHDYLQCISRNKDLSPQIRVQLLLLMNKKTTEFSVKSLWISILHRKEAHLPVKNRL